MESLRLRSRGSKSKIQKYSLWTRSLTTCNAQFTKVSSSAGAYYGDTYIYFFPYPLPESRSAHRENRHLVVPQSFRNRYHHPCATPPSWTSPRLRRRRYYRYKHRPGDPPLKRRNNGQGEEAGGGVAGQGWGLLGCPSCDGARGSGHSWVCRVEGQLALVS
jgi:hypothetical protein